ncbi:MAG TPA: class D sortase [Thermoanaerobaculia bacterium]|jgi:sortase A|nr:class D sortase [Thermoanaerobaculia bacterium]
MQNVAEKSSALIWLERVLLLVAVFCLGSWAWAWLDATYTQYRDSQILDEARSSAPPAESAPSAPSAESTDRLDTFQPSSTETQERPVIAQGSLVGRIAIPRLDVSTIVLEGVDATTLRRGAGHIPETSLPGDRGNVGIAAHRDSFFRALKDIRKDDLIRLETLEGTFQYRVDWTRIVTPEDTEVLDDTAAPALTLVTCYPFYYVGSAPKRFIVRAVRVDPGGTAAGIGAQ